MFICIVKPDQYEPRFISSVNKDWSASVTYHHGSHLQRYRMTGYFWIQFSHWRNTSHSRILQVFIRCNQNYIL